jgi:hypothetical protein
VEWTATDPDKDSLKYTTLRKDTAIDVLLCILTFPKRDYTSKNWTYSTSHYWQVSAPDGINPPVLSKKRHLQPLLLPNARFFISLKKEK